MFGNLWYHNIVAAILAALYNITLIPGAGGTI